MNRQDVLRQAADAAWEDDQGNTMRLALGLAHDAGATINAFRGHQMGGRRAAGVYSPWLWHDSPVPEGGEWASMSDMLPEGQYSSYGGTEYVLIPLTEWGDYIGDTLTRANARALQEDFPDIFVRAEGAYGAESLYLPAHAVIPERLYEIIVSLVSDYPLYSDESHSMLEIELEWEAWESYGESELRYKVASELVGPDGDPWDGEAMLDSFNLRELYLQARDDVNFYPYCEDAVSCVLWTDRSGVVERVAELVVKMTTRGLAVVQAIANRQTFTTYGALSAQDGLYGSGELGGPDLDAYMRDRRTATYAVYSYATPIAWENRDGTVHRVTQKFSRTTGRYMGNLYLFKSREGIDTLTSV